MHLSLVIFRLISHHKFTIQTRRISAIFRPRGKRKEHVEISFLRATEPLAYKLFYRTHANCLRRCLHQNSRYTKDDTKATAHVGHWCRSHPWRTNYTESRFLCHHQSDSFHQRSETGKTQKPNPLWLHYFFVSSFGSPIFLVAVLVQRKVAPPCALCRGKGFVMCKLCKGNATIYWSPLYDPVAINPCLCPTCDGNRLLYAFSFILLVISQSFWSSF